MKDPPFEEKEGKKEKQMTAAAEEQIMTDAGIRADPRLKSSLPV